MTQIIAGRFDESAQADRAVEALRSRGFEGDDVSVFFLNPPGQRDNFSIGGDRDVSPGATEAHTGAMKAAAVGGSVGLGIGLATAPFLGPVGPLAGAGLGAYAGSLVGALSDMKGGGDSPQAETDTATDDPEVREESSKPVRQGGVMVAVRVADTARRGSVAEALFSTGAQDVEHADGTWEAGRWADFDPVKPPMLLDQSESVGPVGVSGAATDPALWRGEPRS